MNSKKLPDLVGTDGDIKIAHRIRAAFVWEFEREFNRTALACEDVQDKKIEVKTAYFIKIAAFEHYFFSEENAIVWIRRAGKSLFSEFLDFCIATNGNLRRLT